MRLIEKFLVSAGRYLEDARLTSGVEAVINKANFFTNALALTEEINDLGSLLQAEYLMHWLEKADSRGYETVVSITGVNHIPKILQTLRNTKQSLYAASKPEVLVTDAKYSAMIQESDKNIRITEIG